jgi:hypothetical protein
MARHMRRKRKQLSASASHARTRKRQRSFENETPNYCEIAASDGYQTENDDPSDSDMEVFDVGCSESPNIDGIFARLQQAMKSKVDDRKLRWKYTGLSKRTAQRKKKQLKDAAIGTPPLTAFFDSVLPEQNDAAAKATNVADASDVFECENYRINKQEIEYGIQFAENIMKESLSKTQKVRYTSVIYYLHLCSTGKTKKEASEIVSDIHNSGPWRARSIRKWAAMCIRCEFLFSFPIAINVKKYDIYFFFILAERIPQSLRGKFPSKSLLHDEIVSIGISSFLRLNKFKVGPALVKKHFEENILPALNISSAHSISLHTIRRWMHAFGFHLKRYQKGIYTDGHERPDVVEYRKIFLQQVAEYDRLMSKWLDKECKIRTPPQLGPGEKEHIWVTHDESTFHSYDGCRAFWGPEGEQPLLKKGLGQGIHVSDFVTETIGPLKDEEREARVIITLGAAYDGYWNSEKLVEQVHKAVAIFERTHPGCIGIFAFDNATSHTAFAPDALVAKRMSKGYGGKQPKMRATFWGNGQRQSMVIEGDFFQFDKKTKQMVNLRGEPKGLEWVLRERGLWPVGGLNLECARCPMQDGETHVIDCCARRLMANQPDFLAERGLIQTIIENRGHKVYPICWRFMTQMISILTFYFRLFSIRNSTRN